MRLHMKLSLGQYNKRLLQVCADTVFLSKTPFFSRLRVPGKVTVLLRISSPRPTNKPFVRLEVEFIKGL